MLRNHIELGTIKGAMHFAPRKGILATEQARYAQATLDSILTSLPPTQQLDGV